MSDLHLVTGHRGEAHITAVDHGSLNAAVFGEGDYVLNRGNKFSASYIGSNTIRVLDGDLVIQGRHVRLAAGSTADIAITTVSSSYKRNTLICAKYTRNTSTGVESCELVTMNGTMTTGTPKDPTVTKGNVLTGAATTHYFPLYRVPVAGATIGAPEPLFDTVELVKVGSDGKIAENFLPDLNFIPASQMGTANGVAPLDSNKKVPVANLPVSDSVGSNSNASVATSAAVFAANILAQSAKTAIDAAGEYEYQTTTYSSSGLTLQSHKVGRLVICKANIVPTDPIIGRDFAINLHWKPCFTDSNYPTTVFTSDVESGAVSSVSLEKGKKNATLYVACYSASSNTFFITFAYIAEE